MGGRAPTPPPQALAAQHGAGPRVSQPHWKGQCARHTMPLILHGVAFRPEAPSRVPEATPTEAFKVLCEEFKIDPKVGDYLANSYGLQGLEDFLELFTSPDQVQGFVDRIEGLAYPRRAVARVRRAWEQLRDHKAIMDDSGPTGGSTSSQAL